MTYEKLPSDFRNFRNLRNFFLLRAFSLSLSLCLSLSQLKRTTKAKSCDENKDDQAANRSSVWNNEMKEWKEVVNCTVLLCKIHRRSRICSCHLTHTEQSKTLQHTPVFPHCTQPFYDNCKFICI